MRLLIYDGDDTLWGTSDIFYYAQIQALTEINEIVKNIVPENEFRTLQKFDDRLIQLNKKPEYDFTQLFISLLLHYENRDPINQAISKSRDLLKRDTVDLTKDRAAKINDNFVKNLLKIPDLYSGTINTLKTSKEWGYYIILISEGNEKRINKILTHYDLEDYFEKIYLFRKDTQKYLDIIDELAFQNTEEQMKIVVIGDLLDRDIFFGNQIGATTIYKPGGYKPNQKPQNEHEKPDYTINQISDCIPILNKLSSN